MKQIDAMYLARAFIPGLKNFKLSSVCKKLGVSQITICGWERYGKVPDVMLLAQIIKEFKVPFETLFEDYL